MITVTTLLATAATFWAGVAPTAAQQNCPDGVRYNVKSGTAMINQGEQISAEAILKSCVITFRAGRLASYSAEDACMLVIHEYGHAAIGRAAGGPGADEYGHSAAGIMSPTSATKPPGICYQLERKQRRH